ncbi:hypothetical protein [Bacillus sp. OV166]|uniref:hypothetical protein n=1 Tax=Bacillus sp. OV166 TaxID=1882763 RepID=UPI0015C4F903|nr:hypothetical protein [Bacillus sp. OV166]
MMQLLGKDSPTEEDWRTELEQSKKGKIYSNAFNTITILQYDERLKGKFAFNLLEQGPKSWEKYLGKGLILPKRLQTMMIPAYETIYPFITALKQRILSMMP